MKLQTYILILTFLCVLDQPLKASVLLLQQQNTTKQDTLDPYEPSERATFQPSYRYGSPFVHRISRSPLFLQDPSQLDIQVQFNPDTTADDAGITYSVYENLGNLDFRPASTMTFLEFNEYHNSQLNREYFKERSAELDGESAVSGRNLIPRIYINPIFDRIFGGSYVDIQPNGFVNLDFGGRFQRIDNPAIPRRQQRNGGFNFDQQISMNLVGQVGEKLAITANFDNNSTFDFQNNLKVEYTGYEEDIIKKIELGNVSMPVTNSLMSGAQSLFGIKTELQFGKLWITTVASQQRGRNETLTIESGFQGREFELQGSDYDENRHFWLGHFFRDNYETWLSALPQIISGININRVEVYVLNRNNDTETTRNIIAFQDLGEASRIANENTSPAPSQPVGSPARNNANSLYEMLPPRNTKVSNLPDELTEKGLNSGTDFVLITTARKLDDTEYTINRELGYITLQRKLHSDEVLAVSYQYTYNGNVYQVGEIQTDYSTRADDEAIFLKMLRPNQIATNQPTWDLMMKNIYHLNAAQVSREGFQLRVIYRDDETGQDNPALHEGQQLKDRPLIEVLGLDQLNPNNDRQPDANFDFIEGITIDTRNGNIIFPVREPFGEHLQSFFNDNELDLIEKYVFDDLYSDTQIEASRNATLNKFFISGQFTAGSSSEIALPGINIAEGSVVVTAGGTLLTEGLDYNVDYNLGVVRILNDGILNSGKQLNVAYEKADLFNFQTRTLTGARFDYRFNENFNIGTTILHLNERPGGISRFAVGSEPTRNTKYGFDINLQQDSRFLTKMIDAIPLVNTKESSNINFNAEFAQLIPGTSNIVNGEGTSYIDDFENAVTPNNIGGWQSWKLASTPEDFDDTGLFGELGINYRRAKMAWYTVDNSIFYRSTGNLRPGNITDDDLANQYERPVLPQEIFPQRDNTQVVLNEPLLDVAYFPSERGPYNYNPDVDFSNASAPQGILRPTKVPPERNWAGITRAITNEVNFIQTNIQYLEFWLMDPFIEGPNGIVQDGVFNHTTHANNKGKLFYHFGSVSEDIAPDNQFAFENGLPEDGQGELNSTWGLVPSDPLLTNFFANTSGARDHQDVGLDGLPDERENEILERNFPGQNRSFMQDPSADNFTYFLDGQYDELNAKIVQRYKNWNGMDGNSPISDGGNQNFIPASTTLPDKEDINNDNTITDQEQYFEYEIDLVPGRLNANNATDPVNRYIVDQITSAGATWYLYRIPLHDFTNKRGDPTLENIRYIRMFLTGFVQPVVLRFAQMRLVGSQWIKSEQSLREEGLAEIPNVETSDFEVSVVNIEENSASNGGSPYVLPPGLDRDIDNTMTVNRRINEQSLQICVDNLEDKDARAVFKNVNHDLINYGRMQMFLHAESYTEDNVQDDEVTGFVRLGTDENENYYEVEVPLKITPRGVSATQPDVQRAVWPAANEIDISINELIGIKSERNRTKLPIDIPYRTVSNDGRYTFSIKGNPDISTIKVLMIGVRNPGRDATNRNTDDGLSKSVCIWANELRVTDFDKNAGWAANARLSTKFADLATISASTRYTSIGFGNIQQRISERSRAETTQYDLSANINLEKFMKPEKTGLVIPMFTSYERTLVAPQFDPLDPDVPLEASLATFDSESEREAYRRIVEDRTTRRSLNFTNVRKEKVNPEAPSRIYDIENFSVSYAYSDQVRSNSNMHSFINKTVSGGLNYNYSPSLVSIEPFKNSDKLNSPYMAIIKDFNFSPIPSNVSFSTDLRRNFRSTIYYDAELNPVEPVFERLFTFVRNYTFRWDITQSLNVNYNATANAVIDEPDGIIEGDVTTRSEKKFIWDQILNLGRLKNFSQNIAANYQLPLDKFPLTDWVSSDVRYSVNYEWIAGSIVNQTNVAQNSIDSLFFGNFLSNQRDINFNTQLHITKLYDKVTFLKDVNAPTSPNDKPSSGQSMLKFLTMLKTVSGSYHIRESTELPGFNRQAFLFGLDSGFNAPGIGFILGSQDPNIRFEAAENGWLIKNPNLNSPFRQTKNTDISIQAGLEPAKELKVQLSWQRTLTNSYQEIFRFDETSGGFTTLTPSRTGNYSISFLSIGTAFEPQREDHFSKAFADFERNIEQVRNRLNALNASGEYDSLSQDALIPAFVAAYSGRSGTDVDLSPFPRTPLPNWQINYTGLSKISALQEVFSSITLSHGYNSTYSISGFNNRVFDEEILNLQNSLLDYPSAQLATDGSNRLLPIYVINQAIISEQFVPLIGINLRTTAGFSSRIELKKSRNLTLNMVNAQVTETNNQDITIDFGYTKTEFKLPWKFQGRTITLDNNLAMRVAASVRDSRTIQRKIDDEDIITNGSRTFQMRPTMTYSLNDQLNLSIYFERNVTNPKVLRSFKTATSAFGIQLRFGLAQ